MLAINITQENTVSRSRIYANAVKTVLEQACKKVRCQKSAAVSVIFVSDGKMRQLNRRYRGKNKTTNVLSFHGDGTDLGDIFISVPEAKREAKKYGWTMQYEIARLALHGFFHLLGYDHEQEREARRMEAIENKILKTIPQEKPNFKAQMSNQIQSPKLKF